MIRRVNTQYLALVFFFALCQVFGTVSALPDLSVAEGAASLVENGIVCPMHGTNICPLSLTSFSERRIKNSMVSDVDHAAVLLSVSTALTSPSVPAPRSGRSVLSIVPISIGSSSVLRI
jgi:hypothetical protein